MFTGIIQSIGKLKQEGNILEIEILDNLFDMSIGDSIAVDGICLTVKEIVQNKFTVDVSEETLKKTTLGVKSNLNQIVNLEPALRVSDRLGGHIVSGHVDGLGKVENIEKLEKHVTEEKDSRAFKQTCLVGCLEVDNVSKCLDSNDAFLKMTIELATGDSIAFVENRNNWPDYVKEVCCTQTY